MEKMAWDGPKWGPGGFFPTNPDLADVDPKVLDFQVPRFPKFGLGRAGLGPWGGEMLASQYRKTCGFTVSIWWKSGCGKLLGDTSNIWTAGPF